MIDANSKIAWDAWPVLGDTPLLPGEKRRLGFVFLSDEAPEKMKAAGQFFLWEGKVIGEAVVVDSNVLGTVFEA